MSGIPISPKHGVNPMLTLCFYCQEPSGVALLGRLKGDAEAPRQATLDKEPCRECADHMERGIILISVRDDEPHTDNPYRTGGWVVLAAEAIERLVTPPELCEAILERRFAYIENKTWALLGLPPLGEES